jgi:hypothetical protein
MKVHRIVRRLGAALLASVILACGPARAELHAFVDSDLLDVLERNGPPPLALDAPAIRSDSARRQVVPRMCEGIGEMALGTLAAVSDVEEAFAYIPQTCTWIDIGVDQTASSVRVDRRLIDDLAATFGRVIVYHIHPRTSDAQASYLPAFTDLLAVVLINSRYSGDDAVHILHRAVTPAGIFEYSFEPSGAGKERLDLIFRTGLGRFAGENLLPEYTAPEHERAYYDAVETCRASTDGAVWPPASCFPMRAGEFLLRHRIGPREGAAVAAR